MCKCCSFFYFSSYNFWALIKLMVEHYVPLVIFLWLGSRSLIWYCNFPTVFSPLLFVRHYNNWYWLLASNHLTGNLPQALLSWTSPDISLSKLSSLSSYSLSKTSVCARQMEGSLVRILSSLTIGAFVLPPT